MPATRTVYVVDDDPMLRQSVVRLLAAASFLAVPLPSGQELLQTAPSKSEGCILLDLRLAQFDGLKLQVRLQKMGVSLPVIIMTGHGDVESAVQAMKQGAIDFLQKPFDERRLIETVEFALARGARRERTLARGEAVQRLDKLSRRERQVLDALVAGERNKLIAYRLGLSIRTIELHRANLLKRLGVSCAAAAVALATVASLPD